MGFQRARAEPKGIVSATGGFKGVQKLRSGGSIPVCDRHKCQGRKGERVVTPLAQLLCRAVNFISSSHLAFINSLSATFSVSTPPKNCSCGCYDLNYNGKSQNAICAQGRSPSRSLNANTFSEHTSKKLFVWLLRLQV
jgi:hypothetical protein